MASCAELHGLHGHDARTAESTSEALALLDGWEPDVALVDLWMPGRSGYELARWLRVRGARCPLLVAVTGLDTGPYRDWAAEAGFDHFLVKPVDPDVITDLLRDHAARSKDPHTCRRITARGFADAETLMSLTRPARSESYYHCVRANGRRA